MTASADESWYLLRDERQLGPMTSASLRQLVSRGMVRRTDLVWTAGLPDWIPAERSSALPGDVWDSREPPPLPRHGFRIAPPPLPEDFVAAEQPIQAVSDNSTSADCKDGNDKSGNSAIAHARDPGYLVRHWRGQLSLPISFWFNGFLGYALATLSVAPIGASSLLRTEFSPAILLISLAASWAFTFVVLCWQFVGTWRAASKCARETWPVFWQAAAKLALCIAAATTLSHFVSRGLPQIREAYTIYMGDEEVGKYAFRILRDGAELEFSGGITFGAAKDFAKLVDTMGGLKTIHLNSPGGRIREAQRMGNLIKTHHLDTYVVNSCLSACTILFLSGQNRFVGPNAKIGFHQPSFAGLTEEERTELAEDEERRLVGFGLSPQFARHAVEAPPSDMWIPSHQELIAEKVATDIAGSSKFALSGFGTADITLETTDEVLRAVPTYQAVARMDSKAYQEIRAQVFDGLRRGKSASEISLQIDPIISKLFDRALPQSSPATLVDYTSMMVRHMRRLNRDDPAYCYVYLNPQEDAANKLMLLGTKYPELLADESAIRSKVFNTHQAEIPADPAEENVDASLAEIFKSLERRLGKDVRLISAKNISQESYFAYCNVMAAFYDEVLQLPENTRTASLRSLYKADE